ncbi:MAG: sulfite exporter TauE/SafE family protein [Candidatus Binataceae bacterium]
MEWLAGYLAIGAFVGFCAGLLGIGGGAIMVPLLVALFEAQGMPREQVLHVAVGSSMATILFTSLSSVRSHASRGALRWDIVRGITPGILAGGLAGSAIASRIPTALFAALFAATVFAAATNMVLERKPRSSRELPAATGLVAVGFVISVVSAFAAVGGAFLAVPFMLWCNVPMLQAIGTASAIGFPIAVAGSVGFAASGWGQAGLPPWSIGYIYLPATASVAVASMLFAPFGVAVAHRMPTRRLRHIFAVLLYAMAASLIVKLW